MYAMLERIKKFIFGGDRPESIDKQLHPKYRMPITVTKVEEFHKMNPAEAIVRAWTEEGPHPLKHKLMQERVKKDLPRIAALIEQLVYISKTTGMEQAWGPTLETLAFEWKGFPGSLTPFEMYKGTLRLIFPGLGIGLDNLVNHEKESK